MPSTGAALNKLNIMQEATSRDFRGGLDVADSELNLSSKFARELTNMVPGIDGSLDVRQGTRLFADITELTNGHIVNMRYFAGNIISVDNFGQVFATNARGVTARIWDSVIAAAKRPGLETWGATSFVAFVEFTGSLVLANGIDKPLTINVGLIVDYLADLGTGSNINVPITHHIQKFNRHGVFAIGSSIYVSERDAIGTWPGDSGTVYTGIFDLSTYVTVGDSTIVGLLPFKNYLLVYFKECIVPVQFSEIAAAGAVLASLVIAVDPFSVIANYGAVSPRTLEDIGDMTLSLDIVGVSNTELEKLTKILSPDRPSRLIDPLLQMRTGILSDEMLHDHTFAVYDRRLSMYMMFIPSNDYLYHRKTHGFGYRYIDNLKINSWNTYEGWNWHAGARSSEGRIFFSKAGDTKIFVLGDHVNDPIGADYMGYMETFSDETTFTDQTGLSPVASLATSGIPIKWAWELPWTDLKHRARTKTLRYVKIDVTGDQEFIMQAFVDKMDVLVDGGEPFKDGTLFTDNTGFVYVEPVRTPALEIPYIGSDAGGFGIQSYGESPYGGGNNTGIPANTLAPTKFEMLKLRFEGETMGSLQFIALTLLYQTGSIRRMLAP